MKLSLTPNDFLFLLHSDQIQMFQGYNVSLEKVKNFEEEKNEEKSGKVAKIGEKMSCRSNVCRSQFSKVTLCVQNLKWQ